MCQITLQSLKLKISKIGEDCKKFANKIVWPVGCGDDICVKASYKYNKNIKFFDIHYTLINDASKTIYACMDKSFIPKEDETTHKVGKTESYGKYYDIYKNLTIY